MVVNYIVFRYKLLVIYLVLLCDSAMHFLFNRSPEVRDTGLEHMICRNKAELSSHPIILFSVLVLLWHIYDRHIR